MEYNGTCEYGKYGIMDGHKEIIYYLVIIIMNLTTFHTVQYCVNNLPV